MSKTILLVEDDVDDREFLFEAVKKINSSVNVVFAENGLDALQYLSKSKEKANLPCLIVLDLNMPVLDGKETFRKIKEELKLEATPVIIFTSSLNPNDKALFNSLGVELITKPYDLAYMNEIVSHMLNVCDASKS